MSDRPMTREAAWIQIGRALICIAMLSPFLYWALIDRDWLVALVFSAFWLMFAYFIAKAARIVRSG